jgi:hypothetical protein
MMNNAKKKNPSIEMAMNVNGNANDFVGLTHAMPLMNENMKYSTNM